MKTLDEDQKKLFEQTLIERGLLRLPKPPGRRVDRDPFQEIAAELFVAESDGVFNQEASKKKKKTTKSTKKKTKPKRRKE